MTGQEPNSAAALVIVVGMAISLIVFPLIALLVVR